MLGEKLFYFSTKKYVILLPIFIITDKELMVRGLQTRLRLSESLIGMRLISTARNWPIL